MKRIAAFILAALMISSAAIADEILFRDIPWGSDVNSVERELKDSCGGFTTTLEETLVPMWTENPFDMLTEYTDYAAGWNTYSYTDELVVAGYPVHYVECYCHYGIINGAVSKDANDSSLYWAEYTFDVLDIQAAYDDLNSKITSLYGIGAETVETGSGFLIDADGKHDYDKTERYTKWIGENNTAVILACSTTTLGVEMDYWNNKLIVRYGKTDANSKLNAISKASKADLVSAEAAARSEDTSGL